MKKIVARIVPESPRPGHPDTMVCICLCCHHAFSRRYMESPRRPVNGEPYEKCPNCGVPNRKEVEVLEMHE